MRQLLDFIQNFDQPSSGTPPDDSERQTRELGERILGFEASSEDEFALATELGASHQTGIRYSRNI